jgi:hypothetical protein
MSVAQQELAGCLRSWRERVTPAEAGLTAGSQRRVPGLRREEVAQLAGVWVDYLAAWSKAVLSGRHRPCWQRSDSDGAPGDRNPGAPCPQQHP